VQILHQGRSSFAQFFASEMTANRVLREIASSAENALSYTSSQMAASSIGQIWVLEEDI
jgi:hypothetical protein